jgi:hypothetical protein
MLIDFRVNHHSVMKFDSCNLNAFLAKPLVTLRTMYHYRAKKEPYLNPNDTYQDELNYLIKEIADFTSEENEN